MAPAKHHRPHHAKNMLPIIPGVATPFIIPPQNREIVEHHGRIYILVFLVILAAGIFTALYFTGVIRFTLPVVPAQFPPPPVPRPVTPSSACSLLNCSAKGPNFICNEFGNNQAHCVCNPPFGGPDCNDCNYAGPFTNIQAGPTYGSVTMQLSPTTNPPCGVCQMITSPGATPINLPNLDIGSCQTCTGNVQGNLGTNCVICQTGSNIGECPGTGTSGPTGGTPGNNPSCTLSCNSNSSCGQDDKNNTTCLCNFKAPSGLAFRACTTPPCLATDLDGCSICVYADGSTENSVLQNGSTTPTCPSASAALPGRNPSNEPAFAGIVIGISIGLVVVVLSMIALLYYKSFFAGPQSAFYVLIRLLLVLGLGLFIFGAICWADAVCWYNNIGNPSASQNCQLTGLFKGGLPWQQNGALWLGLVLMCLCILVMNVANIRGYATPESRKAERDLEIERRKAERDLEIERENAQVIVETPLFEITPEERERQEAFRKTGGMFNVFDAGEIEASKLPKNKPVKEDTGKGMFGE